MKTIKKIKLKQNNSKEFLVTGFYPNGQGGVHDRYRVEIEGKALIFDEPVLKELFEEPFLIDFDEKGEQVGEAYREVAGVKQPVETVQPVIEAQSIGQDVEAVPFNLGEFIQNHKESLKKQLDEMGIKYIYNSSIETLLAKLEKEEEKEEEEEEEEEIKNKS